MNKYDVFFEEFKEFIFLLELLEKSDFNDLEESEIMEFELSQNLEFDVATKSYLKHFGGILRGNSIFRMIFCFDLNSIKEAIEEGEKCNIHQQILDNQHKDIESNYPIKLERPLKDIILIRCDLGDCFSFVEQGVENPIIYGFFSKGLEIGHECDMILSGNYNILNSLRHFLFSVVYLKIKEYSYIDFPKIDKIEWKNALEFLVDNHDNVFWDWRGEFYYKTQKEDEIMSVDMFEYEFIKFVVYDKGILELEKFIQDTSIVFYNYLADNE